MVRPSLRLFALRGSFARRGHPCALAVFLLTAASLGAASPGFVGLERLADELGMETVSGTRDGEELLRLRGSGVTLDFAGNSRIVTLNGIRVLLGDPVLEVEGALYLSVPDWELSLRPILQPHRYPDPPPVRRIVLDAGHGGKDPGALNSAAGLREKDLALDLARRVGGKLRESGFEVLATRNEDVFLSLGERPAAANRAGADLFLSIHFNSARPEVRGVESFVLTLEGDASTGRLKVEEADRREYPGNRNDPWNALVGYYLQRELVAATGLPDRGLKRARFAVLETLDCPGVLLELGFLSNPSTAALLRDSAYRDRLADAVAAGVERYRRTMDRLRASDQP